MFPDEMAAIACKVVFFIFAICAMCMTRVHSADITTLSSQTLKSPVLVVRSL